MNILLWIQPTGKDTYRNYFWAIKKWLDMQSEWHDIFFLVAQYHANASDEATKRYDKFSERLGAKHVCEQWNNTLELFYKLSHSTSVSELETSTVSNERTDAPYALISSPYGLWDIIDSECDAVIVWDDQEPHMHFYREIARRNGYKVATTIKSDTPRIMSIKDPSVKMSKSLWDSHCIYIDDTLEDIQKKIKSAPTTQQWLDNLWTCKALLCRFWCIEVLIIKKKSSFTSIYSYFN